MLRAVIARDDRFANPIGKKNHLISAVLFAGNSAWEKIRVRKYLQGRAGRRPYMEGNLVRGMP